MSVFDPNQDSFEIFDEGLLDLYDEQFHFGAFKKLIEKKASQSDKVLNGAFKSMQNDDPNLVVDLSDEMKEKYKKGLLRFDKDKNGNMYAQLRDENGKYSKKLNIKEQINETDLILASQLNSIQNLLIEIVDTLEDIENSVNDVLSGLHNDRVGLYYSGLSLYLEALQATDKELKKELIAQSLKSLNDSQAQIVQEFKSDIAYLKSPDFLKTKIKKYDRLVEKMQNIHECYQNINRIITLKAMIYFDNNQFSSLMMVYTEYQRFISGVVKPNAGFLIECDPQDDYLMNEIWNKRVNSLAKCKEIQRQLRNHTMFIEWEDKENGYKEKSMS